MKLYFCVAFVFLLLCISIPSSASAVVYTYTGNSFTNASVPYTTSMSVRGWFQIDTQIPPSSVYPTDISASIINYSFSNGVQTLDNNNSAIFLANFGTDISGNIIQWRVIIRSPFPATVGSNVIEIFTASTPSPWDGTHSGICLSVSGGVCAIYIPVSISADVLNNGSWESVLSVPTMTEWGMIIFVAIAGLGSIYSLRRKKIEG